MTERPLSLSVPELGPFFGPQHTALAAELRAMFANDPFEGARSDRAVAERMGEPLGLYRQLVPEGDATVDVRSLVLVREALGQTHPMADSIFAVQGLGSFPIARAGSEAQREKYLDAMVRGARIGAFGLTEPEAGSDVASLRTTATRDGDGWVLEGEKTLISNATIADNFVVFANANPAAGRKGITAFVVDRDAPGLSVEAIPMTVDHPIGRVFFRGCRVGPESLLGRVGEGFALAMSTLDAFRISVGAAANGMTSRALACTLRHVQQRRQFGAPLADQQMVKAKLAEIATDLLASRLLVARAAYARDHDQPAAGALAAMAKMHATETAFASIDKAVQLHGGMGVVEGSEVERLLREVRPLRIYEGTTEIQKLIIAKHLLT